MIWQDFMFACGIYPCHQEFQDSVSKEAEVQVTRLRRHPSVILFCGNNEDYQVAEQEVGFQYGDEDPDSWLKGKLPARLIYENVSRIACLSPGRSTDDFKSSSPTSYVVYHQTRLTILARLFRPQRRHLTNHPNLQTQLQAISTSGTYITAGKRLTNPTLTKPVASCPNSACRLCRA